MGTFLLFLTACHFAENEAGSGFPMDNTVFSSDSLSVGLELSINELLFDPIGDGSDYVEVVNRSGRAIDLSNVYIHNRNARGELNAGKVLSSTSLLLPSGGYVLLCSDVENIRQCFGLPSDSLCLTIKSMPSMPNDKGCVVLTDGKGRIMDECVYTKKMHHPLVSLSEGLALEKLHPDWPSNRSDSWTSASTQTKGTPACKNSQYRHEAPQSSCGFWTNTDRIRPQKGDSSSLWVLSYRFDESVVATIRIYDRDGYLLQVLAENVLTGTEGCFVWYGASDESGYVRYGLFRIVATYYDLSGRVSRQSFFCRVAC